jgi:hypothetical protein
MPDYPTPTMPSPVTMQMDDESIIMAWVFITLVWIAACVAALFFLRRLDVRLIALGILTAAAALSYASVVPTTYYHVPMLMRLSLILTLGGVAVSLFSALRDPIGSVTHEPLFARKERSDV